MQRSTRATAARISPTRWIYSVRLRQRLPGDQWWILCRWIWLRARRICWRA